MGLAGSAFGLEIMLEENGFNPTIVQARSLDTIIDLSTETTDLAKAIKSLDILNYIDPAAYFGLFFRKDARIIDPKSGKELSTSRKCYDLFVSKLKTGTIVYVDIRNKYALPPTINKNGDDFTEVKISVDGSTPATARDYKYFNTGTTTVNSWPIHIVDETFSNPVAQGSYYDYFKIKLPSLINLIRNYFMYLLITWENPGRRQGAILGRNAMKN